MSLLFVYGTLKRGCRNHQVIEALRLPFVGRACADGYLLNLGPFPGFVYGRDDACVGLDGEPRAPVQGELYEVDNMALKQCDRFEGVPSLYTREEVQVSNLDTGTIEMAYVYQVTEGTIKSYDARNRHITTGNWVE